MKLQKNIIKVSSFSILNAKSEKLITGLRETLLVHESFLTETGEKFVILVRGRAETCNRMRKINQMTKNYHGQ